jgi:hypothetical protein
MLALINALSPKVPFCHALGISITEEEWPCNELCYELFGDGAELASVLKGRPLTKEFHVEVLNPPSYRPDLRSVMEVRFRTVPKMWTPFVTGVVEKTSFERGNASPALCAAFNRWEFLQVAVKAALIHNKTPIRGYPTPPEMIERGIAATPLNLWKYGHELNGYGRHVNVERFRGAVIAQDSAVIRGMGIEFKGLTYECPLSLEERQTLFRAEKKSTEVRVGYEETDVSNVLLYGLGEPIECSLSKGTPDWVRSLSFSEAQLYAKLDRVNSNVEMDKQADSRAEQRAFTETVSRNALKERNEELKAAGMKHLDIKNMESSRGSERAVTGSTTVRTVKTLRGKDAAVRKGALRAFVETFGQRGRAVKPAESGDDQSGKLEPAVTKHADLSPSAKSIEDGYLNLLGDLE